MNNAQPLGRTKCSKLGSLFFVFTEPAMCRQSHKGMQLCQNKPKRRGLSRLGLKRTPLFQRERLDMNSSQFVHTDQEVGAFEECQHTYMYQLPGSGTRLLTEARQAHTPIRGKLAPLRFDKCYVHAVRAIE